MANAFTNFLGQVFNSPTQLKDYAHASRLYVDDFYRLAPKQGFMYYVIFDIASNNNSTVQEFLTKNGREVGLLVKNIELPKFKISTETVNQYNRKTQIQTKLDYQPVSITFHDDHNNTTNSLWKSYYNYYFRDGRNLSGLSTPPTFGETKFKLPGTTIGDTTEYGLNSDQTGPFFRSIEIYQLNRKKFTAFKLINPLISEWSHDRMDQEQSRLLENKMTVVYETVIYATGQVKAGSPGGFAQIHYDTVPGPLSVFGSGNNSLFGPGGVIPGIGEVLGGSGDTSPMGLLRTARGATNLVRNVKNVSKASILSEGLGILNDVARTGKLPSALGGSNPAGISLSTLPGEYPTQATAKNTQGGSNLSIGGLAGTALSQIGGTLGKVAGGIGSGLSSIGTGISGLVNKIIPQTNKPIIQTALPTDSTSLSAIKVEQESIASTLADQIATNTAIKDEIMPKIQAAQVDGDQETVEALYAHLDSIGYTDPSKLEQNLSTVNQNIEIVNSAILSAQATESPIDTVSVENENLGTSPDDYYNVGANPDLNTRPNSVYRDGRDSTTSYYV